MPVILYKAVEAWGLPSLSPASIQAEAYLRLLQVEFEVVICTSPAKSPTGQLPAVEFGTDINSRSVGDEFASARAVLSHLKARGGNLDAALSPAQRAELLAFETLIQTTLEPAVTFSAWCEWAGFAEMRKAAYAPYLPFPINLIMPLIKRRDAYIALGSVNGQQVYEKAAAALNAVGDRLRANVDHDSLYFFGSKPSSLDALLYGYLAFIYASPAAAPALKTAVTSQAPLTSYLTRMTERHFATSAPLAPPASTQGSWSSAAQGQRRAPPPEPSEAEKNQVRSGRLWLLGASLAVGAYVLLSGQYIQVTRPGLGGGGGDDDDDEDDEE